MKQLTDSITLDYKPVPENPRYGAHSFLEPEGKHFLFGCSKKYIGDSGRHNRKACLACRLSEDGADTREQEFILFRIENNQDINIACSSFLRMANSDIVRKTRHDPRLRFRQSAYNGQNWCKTVSVSSYLDMM